MAHIAHEIAGLRLDTKGQKPWPSNITRQTGDYESSFPKVQSGSEIRTSLDFECSKKKLVYKWSEF